MKNLILLLLLSSFLMNSDFISAQNYTSPNSQAYFEGFEGGVFPPAGWNVVNVSGGVVWMAGNFAHTGAKAAICAWQSPGPGEDWMITPRWNIVAGDTLVFWLRPFILTNANIDSLAIRVSTTDSLISSFNTRILYLALNNGYPVVTNYQKYSVSLNQFAGQGIFIAFKHMDWDGCGIFIDDVSVERVTTGIIPQTELPDKFSLSQNYPNPFNPVTKIKYSIAKAGYAKLTVFDALGREVNTLVNQEIKPGSYEISFDGSHLTSGVYFYKLVTDGFTETRKMFLLK